MANGVGLETREGQISEQQIVLLTQLTLVEVARHMDLAALILFEDLQAAGDNVRDRDEIRHSIFQNAAYLRDLHPEFPKQDTLVSQAKLISLLTDQQQLQVLEAAWISVYSPLIQSTRW